MDRSTGRITIDLDPGTDLIAGRVCADDRGSRLFTGWTGLFAELRAIASDNDQMERTDPGAARLHHLTEENQP